jgi:hypothetical protein
MCKNEIMEKAQVNEMACINSGEVMLNLLNAGSNMPAKAGSPTQPKPREAKVIPSWQADK